MEPLDALFQAVEIKLKHGKHNQASLNRELRKQDIMSEYNVC